MVDVRYSFTAQYLRASAIFADSAARIEESYAKMDDDVMRLKHRGVVTAAIMQSAAAVEAESAEVTMHGPGHHLGSAGVHRKAWDFLKPMSDVIDKQESLDRFKLILHVLHKPPMDPGQQPWQDMALLVRVRNELIHYKSAWGKEMEAKRFIKSLKSLNLAPPPFVGKNSNFFPHLFLGAAAAKWAVRTGVAQKSLQRL